MYSLSFGNILVHIWSIHYYYLTFFMIHTICKDTVLIFVLDNLYHSFSCQELIFHMLF